MGRHIAFEAWYDIMGKTIPLFKEGTWENWITSAPLATTSIFNMNYTDNELLKAPPKTPKKRPTNPTKHGKMTLSKTPQRKKTRKTCLLHQTTGHKRGKKKTPSTTLKVQGSPIENTM